MRVLGKVWSLDCTASLFSIFVFVSVDFWVVLLLFLFPDVAILVVRISAGVVVNGACVFSVLFLFWALFVVPTF